MYEILVKLSIAYEPPCYTKTCKMEMFNENAHNAGGYRRPRRGSIRDVHGAGMRTVYPPARQVNTDKKNRL